MTVKSETPKMEIKCSTRWRRWNSPDMSGMIWKWWCLVFVTYCLYLHFVSYRCWNINTRTVCEVYDSDSLCAKVQRQTHFKSPKHTDPRMKILKSNIHNYCTLLRAFGFLQVVCPDESFPILSGAPTSYKISNQLFKSNVKITLCYSDTH